MTDVKRMNRQRQATFSLSESSESSNTTQYTDLEEDNGEIRDTVGMLPQKMNRSQSVYSTQTYISCSNQNKCDEVIKSYTKLKIYFTVLCIVNILIILLVCVFFAVFFIRLSNNNMNLFDYNEKNTIQSKPLEQTQTRPIRNGAGAESFTMPCSMLRRKLNVTDIGDGKQDCNVDDMIDAFMQFAKPREYNEVLHLINGVPKEEHSQHSSGITEHDIVNWQQDEDDNTKQSILFNKERGIIITPSDGFYYVYSRFAFSVNSQELFKNKRRLNNVDIEHSIRKKALNNKHFVIVQEASINCANHSFVHSSYLQRALYLQAGDELKVTISSAGEKQYQDRYSTENFFGIFKL